MIGLFCFDGPLYKDKNGVYCNVTLTNEMFSRYFSVVDQLIIVVRTFKTEQTYEEMNMRPLTLRNIKVVEVNNFNTIKGFLVDKKQFERKIARYVNEADMIFARMPSNTSNSVLKIACRLNKMYLVEVGGCAWDSYWNHGLLGKLVAPLMYYEERKYVARAAYATYVTKRFLQRRYPSNAMSSNCSNVYLMKMADVVLEHRLKKIDKMDMKKVVFGQAVNSIDVKYKGEHLILEVMGRLKKKGIYIEFQVVGPGTGEFLKNEARKHGVLEQLSLVGTLTKEEMFNWYKSIDVYVQPSKQEGLPRSVIEAMSTGCPALGSNIAGIPELLHEDCMFNPNKKSEIISVVERILSIEVMRKRAKENFDCAKEYNLSDIEGRRQNIFEAYRSSVLLTYK